VHCVLPYSEDGRVTETCDVHVTVHRDKFLITKPTRWTNFSNVFILE
jgi:hypothetical protein